MAGGASKPKSGEVVSTITSASTIIRDKSLGLKSEFDENLKNKKKSKLISPEGFFTFCSCYS